MKKFLTVLFLIGISQLSHAQQFVGTGKGKLVFGQAGAQQEYRSQSIYSNMSFITDKVSFHFKTSTFLPVNNSDPNLVNEVFDAGLKGAMEFVGTVPQKVKQLQLKEATSAVVKGHVAYGSVKKPIDLPLKIKKIGDTKYQFTSDGVLSLPSLGISPSSAVWKKTGGQARLTVEIDMRSEL
jgi:hypothetical protein